MKHVLLAREKDLESLYRGLFHTLDDRGMLQYVRTEPTYGHAAGHVYEGFEVGGTTFWIETVRTDAEHAKLLAIIGRLQPIQDLSVLVDAWAKMHHPGDVAEGAVR